MPTIQNSEAGRALASLGAGRPKGAKNKLTIAKEKARIEMETFTTKLAKSLVSSQAKIALGSYHIAIWVRGANGQMQLKKITDDKQIEKLLATGIVDKDYIIVQASEGSWQAGNAVLDRTFGKATEHSKVDVDVKFSLVELARQADERDRLAVDSTDITEN